MLALTRKKGEALMVNNNVEITILEVRGDQVKIGIDAPKDVPIYRKEVYLQIQEENKASFSPEAMDELKHFMEAHGGVKNGNRSNQRRRDDISGK